MRKEKFKFNPETLSYEKVQVSWKERLLKTALFVAPAIVVGLGFYFVLGSIFKSPYEKQLETENAYLNSQLDKMNEELARDLAVLADISQRDNEIYRVVFNAEPFPDELRQMGTGGSDEYSDLLGYEASTKIIENTKKIKKGGGYF